MFLDDSPVECEEVDDRFFFKTADHLEIISPNTTIPQSIAHENSFFQNWEITFFNLVYHAETSPPEHFLCVS